MSIYLVAAAFAGDFKMIAKHLLGIKSFFKKSLAAGVTH